MKKTGWFLTSLCVWITSFAVLGVALQPAQPVPQAPVKPPIVLPVIPPQPITPEPPPKPVEPDCVGVQVPIPSDCRVYNRSGSQCVWCSIECLARYHKIKELYEGTNRLTRHYTWATGPGEVHQVLNSRYPTVKWKQIQNRRQIKSFIKTYVTEKKFGVGLGIPGHMLNLVHYDETTGVVKVIDNCGPRALKIQEWSMDKFDRLAEGWVITVFPPGYVEDGGDEFDYNLPRPFALYDGRNLFKQR